MSDKDNQTSSLERGAALIRRFVKDLPDMPGVYRMLDKDGAPLYVGKARSLKKRVVNYTHPDKLPIRLQRMVAATQDMVFVTTHTEVEALLLESNLIKKLKPRYNILLRDDKSFPYILLTGDHDFPLLTRHRGAQKRKGTYFGPFANAGAVHRTIAALQRAFMLRNCTNNVFSGRTRPCLQYQIKRCTAPCVDLCTKEDYAAQVRQARDFLSGKSNAVKKELAATMKQASDNLDFETAARLRDRITALSTIQARQDINIAHIGDADIMGIALEGGKACVQVFFFRGGQNFGNHAYFPRHNPQDSETEILSAFAAQFYAKKPVPKEIILSHPLENTALFEQAFHVKTIVPQRGDKKRVIDFVLKNAREALARENAKLASEKKHLESIATIFDMEQPPQRIEIYDNSHISGTNMVGGMVVAGPEGFDKKSYRKFNIRHATAADDYGMMREVMERRFKAQENLPALLLIDGGKGQLSAVSAVLEQIGILDKITLVAIAKGPDRNAGREQFFMNGQAHFQLPENDPTLHYLQRLRDEAHRFAIGAHRTRRTKDISKSPLDDISGIGAKRKKALLLHFGSAKDVARAGLADLETVDGISKSIAEKIYHWFHEG